MGAGEPTDDAGELPAEDVSKSELDSASDDAKSSSSSVEKSSSGTLLAPPPKFPVRF